MTELRHPQPLGRAHRHGFQRGDERMHDVCIIGSGASGAVVADHLVRAGLDVVMLESGARVAPGVTERALEACTPRALARDPDGGWTARGWPWTTRNLGGGTVFYGGVSFRYRAIDFDATEHIRVDDLDIEWPYALDEIVPDYVAIEDRLRVCGGDPAEPLAWHRGPAHALDAAGERLWQAAAARGYRPFPTPLAINAVPGRDRPACTADSPCIGHACAIGARADAVTVFLGPIADHPGFTLRTGVHALALGQARRRIDRVCCLDLESGERCEVRAGAFVLACNAIQTAALLLRSRTAESPDGVGNRWGMVGRGLCMKNSAYVRGVVAGMSGRALGPVSTVSLLDHYLDGDAPTGVGGLIYQLQPRDVPAPVPMVQLEVIIADHPAVANRVSLAAERDEHGVPRVVIDYTVDPRDRARLAYLTERCRDLLLACGARDIRTEPSRFELGSAHLHGTCRAGRDPRRSVVDPTSRVHDVDNLYVADGSFMPYPGGANPTLTIQAHALRTARFVERSRPW